MTAWRHDTLGHAVDRTRPIDFTFDGKRYIGFHGDTLASALQANGEQILGRSFKYHRPRGLWGFGAEEPNAIFDVTEDGTTTPNCRATLTPLRPGMDLRAVHASPRAASDRWRVLDLLHRFLPAGFYYKTFMAPRWMLWEPFIRRMAGLGRVDPDHHPAAEVARVSATCDLLVIGAGPAGLAAAHAAARAGRAVWVLEDAAELGGSLRWRGGTINGAPWQDFVADTRKAVTDAEGRVLCNTTVWGAFDHGVFAAWQRRAALPDIHWRLRADEVILAAGAVERPMWFADNDLPGVQSAEAALAHLQLHGVVPGRKILLATANDATSPVARALVEAGAQVTVLDRRSGAAPIPGVSQITGVKVEAALGSRVLTGVRLSGGRILAADCLLVSGGYTPSVQIWCQAGGKLDWSEPCDAFVPRTGSAALSVAGAATGAFALDHVLATGWQAGGGAPGEAPVSDAPNHMTLSPVRPDPELPGRQWVDFQNDVTLKDVGLAAREGFQSVEHLKRYTTLGMATDQGRTSNMAGLSAMAAFTGRSIPETGTTTFRPPVQPVPMAVIAGRARGELFNPPKRLPLEDRHLAAGAHLREYGGWLRPAHYGGGPEAEADAAYREASTARQSVALFDGSPLGKLEVMGPGAGALLDFTGYQRMSTLPVGRARYGLMLTEGGLVHDDGVILRLDENRFLVSASSSHVEAVRFRLEDARQDRIGRRAVHIHDVTAAWVTLTVTGPKARDLIRQAGISLPELKHMQVAEVTWQDIPLRAARVSFTGDASFELSVPTRHGPALHDCLDRALQRLAGTWLGLEALMTLRAEKGYILAGKDTDGLTMPQDLGFTGPRTNRNDEFLGKRALFTPAAQSESRRQLVGLSVPEGAQPLPVGAHIVALSGPRRSLGFVTSSHFSPVLDRPIALALLENGRARMGEALHSFDKGTTRRVTICAPCAFDPDGGRLDG